MTKAHMPETLWADGYGEWCSDALGNFNETLYRRADLPVRVKPLNWIDDNDICSTAKTSIGEYVVQEDGNLWRVWPCDWVDDTGEEYPDRPSAKAAAQADHDARIRAALEE
jgi:hypothetical protein